MTNTSTNETTDRAISTSVIPGDFDPDIAGAGLVVNFDASIPSSIAKSINGTTITTWTDQKNGLVATSQANTATYQMSGVKLDGVDYFTIPIFAGLNLTSSMSIFVVATVDDVTANPNGHFICHASGPAGYQFRYGNTPDGEARFNLAGVSDVASAVISWESGIRSSIGVSFEAETTFAYQKNASQLGSSKFSPSGNPLSIITTIGATSSAGEKLVGTINQILIYNTSLSGANLTAVGEGLLKKWSL